jgi:hypothetical protein
MRNRNSSNLVYCGPRPRPSVFQLILACWRREIPKPAPGEIQAKLYPRPR